jgi:hypothetical protein
MKNKLNMTWFNAALIRAVRTMAQTALSLFTIGAAINEVNWQQIASVSVVAGVYSLLTSLSTSLPEIATDGTLQIDKTGISDVYRFNFDKDPGVLATKTMVSFKVDPNAVLPRPNAVEDPSQEKPLL